MSFYDEMQAMVTELLDPSVFGQGVIVLNRVLPSTPDPTARWVEIAPTILCETLKAVASGAEKYADGKTVLATDLRVVAAVPALDWRLPDSGEAAVLYLTIDSTKYTVVASKGIPAAGVPAAVEFIVRG